MTPGPGGEPVGDDGARRGGGVGAGEDLITSAEVQEIELVVLRRMRAYRAGAHPSVFRGDGFEYAGLRDWQPGDRPAAIDWPQSTLTNFSPLVTREFEQASLARLVIAADLSPSTRCGAGGPPVAPAIARTVATLALAGAFLQDQVGLMTFDGRARALQVRPRSGRAHAIHCLDAYRDLVLDRAAPPPFRTGAGFLGLLRQPTLVPVVSDFLVDDPDPLLVELRALAAVHDVFLVLVDSRRAFALPVASAGWVEACDAETGERRLLSADEVRRLGDRVAAWQDEVAAQAAGLGLDVLRLDPEPPDRVPAQLVAFLAGRRRQGRQGAG